MLRRFEGAALRRPGFRGQLSTPALSEFEQLLALAAGRPQFTSDNYNSAASKVTSWIDWSDPTHLLEQTDNTKQVALPAAHVDFGGAVCGAFSAHSYLSNRAAVDWAFASNGVSCEVFHVFTPVDAGVWFIGATAPNAGVTGAHWYSDGNLRHFLGSGATPAINAAGAGATGAGAPTIFHTRHEAASSPDYALRRDGVVTVTGDFAVAADLGAPGQAFELGGRNGGLYAQMRWVYTGFFPALTDNQRAQVEAWILAEYGVG